MPTSSLDIFPARVAELASQRPDGDFLQPVESDVVTFAQAYERSLTWRDLMLRLGVAPGETVLTAVPASVDAVTSWCGIAYVGAIETPINPAFRGDLLDHVISDSRARVAVVHVSFLAEIGQALDSSANIETVVVVDPEPDADLGEKGIPYDRDRPADHGVPVHEAEPHETATILYTSGTTGRSKGVIVPWAQLAETCIGMFGPEDLDGGDVLYSFYPPYHVTWKGGLTRMARDGGRIVIREQFSSVEFWDDVRKYGCTTAILLSAMIYFLYRSPEQPGDADTSLKNVVMVPVVAEVEDFKRRFGVRVKALWNMTEASTQIASHDWDVSDWRSCGKTREGHHARVVDDLDREVPHGQVGELVIRTDEPWLLMAGYWGNPAATVEAWRNQWFHTGDLVSRDEEGNFFFVDRKKDAIRRRGENISSQEVEEAVFLHDDVAEVAAVAAESEWGEDEVLIFVAPKEGRTLDPAELSEFIRPKLAAFMLPRYIEIIDELPKTVTAKTRKIELRQRGRGPATWDRLHGVEDRDRTRSASR